MFKVKAISLVEKLIYGEKFFFERYKSITYNFWEKKANLYQLKVLAGVNQA